MTFNSDKIRILHVITGLSTGGAEMMMFRLMSATLGSLSHSVISLKDEGTLGPRIRALGVPVQALGLRPLLPNPFRLLSVVSRIHKFRPDVIQGWMHHGDLVATLASRLSGQHTPVIWGVQQSIRKLSDFGLSTALLIRIGALMSNSPDRIIYVSKTGASQHESLGYRAESRVVIPNGVDGEVFSPDADARRAVRKELGIDPEVVLIGLVARYHPMKDHAGFLRAAAHLIRRGASARFLLAGEGVNIEQPALRKLIAELGLENHVLLLGERDDTPRLTAALDIACSASAWGEAFSVAIGEAMACGVPCIVTDVGDNAYLVGNTGISVPPSDPNALAQAIESLIDAGLVRRKELGAAARERMESQFSLAAVTTRYQDLYREVVSRKSENLRASGNTKALAKQASEFSVGSTSAKQEKETTN